MFLRQVCCLLAVEHGNVSVNLMETLNEKGYDNADREDGEDGDEKPDAPADRHDRHQIPVPNLQPANT